MTRNTTTGPTGQIFTEKIFMDQGAIFLALTISDDDTWKIGDTG